MPVSQKITQSKTIALQPLSGKNYNLAGLDIHSHLIIFFLEKRTESDKIQSYKTILCAKTATNGIHKNN
jgi:hypothetical protein